MNELIAIGLTIVSFGVLGKLLKKEPENVTVPANAETKKPKAKAKKKQAKKPAEENVEVIEEINPDDKSEITDENKET